MGRPADGRERPEGHPELTPEEHREQRGSEEGGSGMPPRTGDPTSYDPMWEGDPSTVDSWRELLDRAGERHRPRREDVLPYLLIRAHAPGDRARRPLWPPIRSWLSPDILLMDADDDGPFDPSRLVDLPRAGRTYRVFVHVWNLGLLEAAGVLVRAWHVSPGYFAANGLDESYTPEPIGATLVDLGPRTSHAGHRVVELDQPWPIRATLSGHECLLASAECPADNWNGILDANHDRHVGQRNLTIVNGAGLVPMLELLEGRVMRAGMLEIALRDEVSGQAWGLLAAVESDGRLLVIDARALHRAVRHDPGALAEALRDLGDGIWNLDPADTLAEALRRSYDASEDAASERLLDSFGLDSADLDLAQFDPDGRPSGGYTLRLRRQGLLREGLGA